MPCLSPGAPPRRGSHSPSSSFRELRTASPQPANNCSAPTCDETSEGSPLQRVASQGLTPTGTFCGECSTPDRTEGAEVSPSPLAAPTAECCSEKAGCSWSQGGTAGSGTTLCGTNTTLARVAAHYYLFFIVRWGGANPPQFAGDLGGLRLANPNSAGPGQNKRVAHLHPKPGEQARPAPTSMGCVIPGSQGEVYQPEV